MSALLPLLAVIPWLEILAYLMPLIILGVVEIIKKNREWLKPYLPIIAPLLGAVLPIAAAALSGLLGIPIDFSPILAALTGATAGAAAVGVNQIWRQYKKGRM
jgi:hypothetical protein